MPLHIADENEVDLNPLIPFIDGMLTNLGSMDVENMHRMLMMLASTAVSGSFTVSDLNEFLQNCEQVDCVGGQFSLREAK